ncbi:MAG: ribonuclease III family protein [Solirubrobacterales bacterium]
MSWSRRIRERRRRAPDPGRESLRELIGQLPDGRRDEALRHTSWTSERLGSYERLAFLGDSVLGLSVAETLHRDNPTMDAGELTKILNQAVSGEACAEVGEEIGIPEMLKAAEPQGEDGGHTSAASLLAAERPLPEVTEALIGACFLEFGFELTSAAVSKAFTPRIERVRSNRTDFKSALQELLASKGETVSYEVVATEGPPHDRTYEVAAVVGGDDVGRGSGRSKKSAGQAAAEAGLESLEESGPS